MEAYPLTHTGYVSWIFEHQMVANVESTLVPEVDEE